MCQKKRLFFLLTFTTASFRKLKVQKEIKVFFILLYLKRLKILLIQQRVA